MYSTHFPIAIVFTEVSKKAFLSIFVILSGIKIVLKDLYAYEFSPRPYTNYSINNPYLQISTTN